MQATIHRLFWWAIGATVLTKLALAYAVPMTSDEAYFVLWGRYPDIGFYDHPPMIGWMLQFLQQFGNAALLMRLPPILFSSAVGIGIYYLLRSEIGEVKAGLAGLLFTLSPMNLLNVLVTTDAPLLLFTFLSSLSLYRALKTERIGFYALSGVLLGLAFLSKYFAVLLGLAFLVYFFMSAKSPRRIGGFILLYGCALPFVGLNLYYNYLNGWPNIMFNIINRNRDEVFSLGKVALFLVCQLYLMIPPVLYYVSRKGKNLSALLRDDRGLFIVAFAVPMAIFAVLSLKKNIGLHWVLSFYPFYYLLVATVLNEGELWKCVKFMFTFSLVHLVILGAALSLPLHLAKSSRHYDSIIIGFMTDKVLEQFRAYEPEFALATPSYADSALLEFHYKKHVAVFGSGSSHARQDDILTDFRNYDGRNILIFRKSAPGDEEYAKFFHSLQVKTVMIADAPFYFIEGRGFRYEVYRKTILLPIKEQYYNIPRFLPYRNCSFLDKYFPATHR